MATCEITDFMGISHGNIKTWFCCLLHTHARLALPLDIFDSSWGWLNLRRSSRLHSLVLKIFAEAGCLGESVYRAELGSLAGAANRDGLLLGRGSRSWVGGWCIISKRPKRAQVIIESLETSRLNLDSTGPTGSSGRARISRSRGFRSTRTLGGVCG